MYQVNVDEAKEQFLVLIEAAIKGEEIIIIKDNQPLIKLTRVTQPPIQPKAGSAKGLVTLTDDFDEPLEEFKEYMA